MLDEMDGEPVSYTRIVGGSAAAGFPKSIEILFRMDDSSRRMYQDGRGDMTIAMVMVKVSDLGSNPAIGADRITRADATVWIVEEVKEIVGGVATIEVAQYAQIANSSRAARIER